jgi:outer membrane scaffolding protein for murein synthesis (MipA/OmpV family)
VKLRFIPVSAVNVLSSVKAVYGKRMLWTLTILAGACLRNSPAFAQSSGNRLNASYAVVQKPSDMVAVSSDAVWSNGPSEQTYFGIDSAQAATSGLPVYSPSRGFSRVDVKVSCDHRLNDKWSVRSAVGVGDLVGDAANSPIVQRRADVFGSVGAAYHF